MRRLTAIVLWSFLSSGGAHLSPSTEQDWTQFGGPHRNFIVEATGLAETWPASGPKKIWSRALGDGHSSILVDGDRLYTMYSSGSREFVVALDRATGKTVWEKGDAAPTAGVILQVEEYNIRVPIRRRS